MISRTVAAATAVALLIAIPSALGATINVPADQPTIQDAINAAAENGDEIIVAPGTYNEDIDTMGKAVVIRSSDGPTMTTIQGTGTASVITCDDDEELSTVIEGFTITGGTGTSNGIGGFEGGGLYNLIASPTIRLCIFHGNTASGPGGAGGAIYNFFSSPRIVNCLFYDNTATSFGGAIMNDSASTPFIVSCTIADNTALQGGGVFSSSMPNSTARIVNCAIWFNNDDAVAGAAIVSYSNIQNGHSGEGNINLAPEWVDLNGADFRLMSTSPCIDAGDSTAIADEVFEDLDGNPRGVDHTDTSDTGIPVFGLVVDMGAYEFQQPCEDGTASCAGDITGSGGDKPDGVVDVFDLLEMLGNWGACPP